MDELRDRVEALEARLRAVEDELALYRLMTSYGPAADSGDGVKASEIWTEDGVYDADGPGVMAGRGAIVAMLSQEGHQSMVPGMRAPQPPGDHRDRWRPRDRGRVLAGVADGRRPAPRVPARCEPMGVRAHG